MAMEKSVLLPISEKLLDTLKPTLKRLAAIRFKQQVLTNLKSKAREKGGK